MGDVGAGMAPRVRSLTLPIWWAAEGTLASRCSHGKGNRVHNPILQWAAHLYSTQIWGAHDPHLSQRVHAVAESYLPPSCLWLS